ncbi:MAG: hypothetical protein QNJ54_15135 [Prochloraceae cyanobacterium]|nr:hypothetical protein [Prochloraceae cyanobacterium]
MPDLRLNLGCGSRHLEGYINVDKFGNPDILLDLETFPWAWEDNSVVEIEMRHVLEHLGQQTQIYLKILQEIYRICAPGAKIHVVVPHHRHDNFVHDATHVRAITPLGLSMFSQRLNREWQEAGKSYTPLGLYMGVDFELVNTTYVPSEIWFERYPDRSEDKDFLLSESAIYNNLIREVDMTLVAVK